MEGFAQWWVRVKFFWPRSGQVNFLWLGSGQTFIYSLGLNSENFPYKPQIFSLRIKKPSSGQVKKYPGQRRVGLLFTAGQK